MSTEKDIESATVKDLLASGIESKPEQTETGGRGKSGKQLANKKQGGIGKNSANYWQSRIFKPVNSTGEASPNYSMRVSFKGKRMAFTLGTSNQGAAAALAAGIYNDLLTLGIEGTLAKHRAKTDKPEGVATVGEWIAAAAGVAEASKTSFNSYSVCLRKIAGDILAMKKTAKRFGPKKGGAAAYRAAADNISLALLTLPAIQKWRLDYVAKAKNPAQERSKKTSCNSMIRQARSLFAPKIVKFLADYSLPSPLPFAGVEFFPRQSAKYFSRIDPKGLLQAAHTDLAEADAPAFLVMLLALSAGLRRGEIDSLCWHQVDCGRELIRIESTEAASLKTADSRGEVAIDPQVASILQGFKAKATGPFVIEADGAKGGPKKWGQHYRAEFVFNRLTAWLRAHGVTARKPLHELRKELGALVTAEHGIYAASRVLRHSNVATTAAHYSDLKTRPVVNVGGWLTPENVTPFPSGQPEEAKKPATRKRKKSA